MAFAKSGNFTADLRETIPITAFCGIRGDCFGKNVLAMTSFEFVT
jgi:hypothetical protein